RRVPRGQWDLDICPAPANRHGNLSSPGVAPVAVAPASADRYAPGAHGTDRSEGNGRDQGSRRREERRAHDRIRRRADAELSDQHDLSVHERTARSGPRRLVETV